MMLRALLLAAAAILAVSSPRPVDAALSTNLPAPPTNLYDGFVDLGEKLGGTAKARLHWRTSRQTGDLQDYFRYALVFPVGQVIAFGPNFASSSGAERLADLTVVYTNALGTNMYTDTVARISANRTTTLPTYSSLSGACQRLPTVAGEALCNDQAICNTWTTTANTTTCSAQCGRAMLAQGFQANVAPPYGSGQYEIHEFRRPLTRGETCDVSITPATEQNFTVALGSFATNQTAALANANWDYATTFSLKMAKPARKVTIPTDADSKHEPVGRQGTVAGIICGLLFGLIFVVGAIAAGIQLALG
jgi:hypothetical protein